MPTVVEAPLAHVCECGTTFELSARNSRIHRNRGTRPKCERCRFGAKPPKVTQAMRDYWLDRFTLDEIRQMAGAIWPELSAPTANLVPDLVPDLT